MNNTNTKDTNKTATARQANKEATKPNASEPQPKSQAIKLGIDVHLHRYVGQCSSCSG